MKRWLLRSACVSAMLIVMTAAAAYAAGSLNMGWTTCVGEGAPITNKAFACTANAGSSTLVCSVIAPAGIAQLSGVELFVDLISQANPLPNWWSMFTGTACRTGANNPLSSNFIGNGSDLVCLDPWAGAASGNVAGYTNTAAPLPGMSGNAQYMTIDVAGAVPVSAVANLTAGSEYFLANIIINNKLSSGVGACAGCLEPVCLSFTRALLTQPVGVGDFYISTPGSNAVVTWQGVGANCSAVPVRKSTWGAIKSMYR